MNDSKSEIVGQEQGKSRGLDDVGASKTKPDERQENEGGKCNAQRVEVSGLSVTV